MTIALPHNAAAWVLATLLIVRCAAAAATLYSFPADQKGRGIDPLGVPTASETIVVYSTTDIAVARPLIAGFQQRFPTVSLDYHDLQSTDIYDRVIAETRRDEGTADLVLSSAMDLQVKLANDGYARQWTSRDALALPSWAVWRNTAFGVTFEPAVIIYHKPAFTARTPPTTRAALKRLLTDDPSLTGRVATYDVVRSGIGFLFLARDQDHSDTIWRLVALMGRRQVQLFTTSAAMIDRVGRGQLIIGYNVLGSYAAWMARSYPNLGIAEPEEYTVVLSRVALIPAAARRPDLGGRFLDFLLSVDGQRILSRESGLDAIRLEVETGDGRPSLRQRLGPRVRPIRVGPGLLVYMDQAKRRRLLKQWTLALTQPETILP